jgi:hypothetical protein
VVFNPAPRPWIPQFKPNTREPIVRVVAGSSDNRSLRILVDQIHAFNLKALVYLGLLVYTNLSTQRYRKPS